MIWFATVILFLSFDPQFKNALAATLNLPSTSLQGGPGPAMLAGQASNSTALNAFGISPVSLASDGTYYVVLQVGQISFRAALDTGSADFWLTSTECTTSTCTSVPRYPLTYASPTFVSINNNKTTFNVDYADGTGASGFVARETAEVANVTVADQAFGVVTNSNITLVDEVSGILGLGFPRQSEISTSATNATPFFSTLAQQGILDYPLFGLSLTRNATGTLTLGAIDVSVAQNLSQVVWNEVVPFSPVGTQTNTSGYFYWAIPLSSFSGKAFDVNVTQYTPQPTYPGPTGNTSVALLDVGGKGGQWVIPCDSSATMSFSFGEGNSFVLEPTDYIIGPAEGNPDLCLSWPKASPPSADGVDWLLGTPFLRTVYSIWSYGIDYQEPPMIGLYPRNNASAPVQPYAVVQSSLSSESATVATTLPNYPLSTPSYTTPSYAFNTSVPAVYGEIVQSELATSTYSPLIGTLAVNATALPQVSGAYTLLVTNSNGAVVTSTYHVSQPSVALGVPPGWSSAAASLSVPGAGLAISMVIALVAGTWIL
ncbi:acid protease [Suillus paluster]|uniref:acid protease n=1 Tax=Suillus paluster TaxID=48578 RepID=UPI001B860F56|nr:acid protease [Suillus paluster]KAG1747197.1 acid protease [Suillus paluster]